MFFILKDPEAKAGEEAKKKKLFGEMIKWFKRKIYYWLNY